MELLRASILRRGVCGGSSSAGRASVCGTECRGFNPRLPPHFPKYNDSLSAALPALVESLAASTRGAALLAGCLFQQDYIAVVVKPDESQAVVVG
jgi:hypothetical protein